MSFRKAGNSSVSCLDMWTQGRKETLTQEILCELMTSCIVDQMDVRLPRNVQTLKDLESLKDGETTWALNRALAGGMLQLSTITECAA